MVDINQTAVIASILALPEIASKLVDGPNAVKKPRVLHFKHKTRVKRAKASKKSGKGKIAKGWDPIKGEWIHE